MTQTWWIGKYPICPGLLRPAVFLPNFEWMDMEHTLFLKPRSTNLEISKISCNLYFLLNIVFDKILKTCKKFKHLLSLVSASKGPTFDFKYFKSKVTKSSCIFWTFEKFSNWDPSTPFVSRKTMIWNRTLIFSSNIGKLIISFTVLQ